MEPTKKIAQMSPPRLAATLLICAIPLGVAGQNVALAIAALGLIVFNARQRHPWWLNFPKAHFVLVALIVWTAFAIGLNPEASVLGAIPYLVGYSGLLLLPVLAIHPTAWQPPRWVMTTILVGTATVCLSQAIWGWERQGFSLVVGDTRARAFYDHPLTLAYVALLAVPWLTIRALRSLDASRASLCAWLQFFAVLVIIWTSRSRIVQLLTLSCIGLNVLFYLPRRTKAMGITTLAVFVLSIAFIPNPVRKNFVDTFAGRADRHTHEYPDDRVAFWHAHWQLVKERPWLGHGAKLTSEARARGYRKIGLGDFPKQYSAHNQYLQYLVEGGAIGLCLFLAWLVLLARKSWNDRDDDVGQIVFQTIIFFSLGIFTQNAIQDAEVRYALMVALAAYFSWSHRNSTA